MADSIFVIYTSLLFFYISVGISSPTFDPVVPIDNSLSSGGYDLKLMYNNINSGNQQDISTTTISPIKYKYKTTMELLKTTADYYEREVPNTSQNVDKFLNTTLNYVSEKCLLLNDTIRWLRFRLNYTDYRKEAKKLQAYLISPPKENYEKMDGFILATNVIIKMGNFINSLQYCLDDQYRLNEEDVMRVMSLILRQIDKNIFLAGKVNLDEQYREISKTSECTRVFYPMRNSNFLFDALMNDFYSPFESCYLYVDFENCADDLLRNCEPELATKLRISWCPPDYGCNNFSWMQQHFKIIFLN